MTDDATMATTATETLREWSPCHRLLEALSKRAGLFRSSPALTTLDADPDYLAVANDAGHLFWYHRKSDDVLKLRLESTRSPICRIKIVSTVDYMLACGKKNGQIVVFVIPKPRPEDVPDHVKPKSDQQIERYTVTDLHRTEITSLEWSKNGTRLFSGDKNGVVVQTEIDFYMHICKSSVIVNDSYEIVQLSYYQNRLLVSSVLRSIICNLENGKWNVNQVGKKDRKSLSKFGGIFHFDYDKPNDVHIYTTRPGLRIWNSDFQGNVVATLLFKDAILNPTDRVLLLNPATKRKVLSLKDMNFGPLYVFNEKYLVTHSDDVLYVLDPKTFTTFATVDEFRKIISIAVNKREIFVLESEHSIVRLAFFPEIFVPNTEENLMTKSLMNPIQLAIDTIKDIANSESKLYFSGTDRSDPLVDVDDSSILTYTDVTSVVKAEECFELPPVINLTQELDDCIVEQLISSINLDSKSQTFDNIEVLESSPKSSKITSDTTINDKRKNFSTIGNIEYPNDIVHSSKKSNKRIGVPVIDNSQPSGSKSDYKANSVAITTASFRYDYTFFPEKKSPDTLEKEIRDNEEKLAKILNLEPVTICPVVPTSSKENDNESAHFENSKKDDVYSDDNDDIDIAANINIGKNNVKLEKNLKKNQLDLTPKCVTIPNKWNLKDLRIDSNVERKPNKNTDQNSEIDADWELI